MTDPMPTILDILYDSPPEHRFIRTMHEDRIEAFCSCFGWSMESMGRDESSRNFVASEHAAHKQREGNK